MNNLLPGMIIISLFLLSSCSHTQFGVSDEQWQQMTNEQKRLTIEGYNQRQLLAEQRRLEQSRAKAKLTAEKEQQRLIKIENIKNGNGVLGDIIRISILSCEVKLGAKYRAINPIAIKLVDGEKRKMKITVQAHKRKSYSKILPVSYQDGLVTIAAEQSGRRGIYIPYEQSWLRGHRYHSLSATGLVRLKNCDISISVVPGASRRYRWN